MRQGDREGIGAAHDPHVEVVKREGLDPDKHLGVRDLGRRELADLDALISLEFVVIEGFHDHLTLP
jgi:hypothetical protein